MSGEAATKQKIEIDPKYLMRLAGILMIICAIVAALLGVVNAVTYQKIDEIQAQKTQESLQAVFPGASFTEIEVTDELTAIAKQTNAESGLEAIYEASTGGYAIEVTPTGFNGSVDMIVGVDYDGNIVGISVVSNSETAGIGTEVCKDKPNKNGVGVLSQFVGRSGGTDNIFTVNSGSNEVDAISGATVTTKGVTRGVNAACLVFEQLG
jgi:electron transport complex protein RnfG